MLTNHHLAKFLVEERQRELVASAAAVRARRAGRRSTFRRLFDRQHTSPQVAAVALTPRRPAARGPETAPAGRTPAGVEGRAA
jgi:hypothetical protein